VIHHLQKKEQGVKTRTLLSAQVLVKLSGCLCC